MRIFVDEKLTRKDQHIRSECLKKIDIIKIITALVKYKISFLFFSILTKTEEHLLRYKRKAKYIDITLIYFINVHYNLKNLPKNRYDKLNLPKIGHDSDFKVKIVLWCTKEIQC